VLVPVVLKHLEKICSDFVENCAAEDQLLRVFESVFGFLNERANKPGPQTLIAQLSDKHVWPLSMALSRSLNRPQPKISLHVVRAETKPPRKLLAAHELCLDMDLSPCIFRVAADSQLGAFKGLLLAAGVPHVPTVETLMR